MTKAWEENKRLKDRIQKLRDALAAKTKAAEDIAKDRDRRAAQRCKVYDTWAALLLRYIPMRPVASSLSWPSVGSGLHLTGRPQEVQGAAGGGEEGGGDRQGCHLRCAAHAVGATEDARAGGGGQCRHGGEGPAGAEGTPTNCGQISALSGEVSLN
eukprot:scaffold85555_cov38-Prasinocladus_malaysianus.AAC.2